LVFPDDAGSGLAPQIAANDDSPRKRSMFWPAVTSIWPAWPVEIPSSCTRRGDGDELVEVVIEERDLAVERVDPLSERAERELRGIQRPGQVAGGDPESRADGGFAAERLAIGKLVAEWLRCGDEQITDLHERDRAGLDRAVARDAKLPDRFDDPVGLLRDRGRLAG
jgi:hypothetical protein